LPCFRTCPTRSSYVARRLPLSSHEALDAADCGVDDVGRGERAGWMRPAAPQPPAPPSSAGRPRRRPKSSAWAGGLWRARRGRQPGGCPPADGRISRGATPRRWPQAQVGDHRTGRPHHGALERRRAAAFQRPPARPGREARLRRRSPRADRWRRGRPRPGGSRVAAAHGLGEAVLALAAGMRPSHPRMAAPRARSPAGKRRQGPRGGRAAGLASMRPATLAPIHAPTCRFEGVGAQCIVALRAAPGGGRGAARRRLPPRHHQRPLPRPGRGPPAAPREPAAPGGRRRRDAAARPATRPAGLAGRGAPARRRGRDPGRGRSGSARRRRDRVACSSSTLPRRTIASNAVPDRRGRRGHGLWPKGAGVDRPSCSKARELVAFGRLPLARAFRVRAGVAGSPLSPPLRHRRPDPRRGPRGLATAAASRRSGCPTGSSRRCATSTLTTRPCTPPRPRARGRRPRAPRRCGRSAPPRGRRSTASASGEGPGARRPPAARGRAPPAPASPSAAPRRPRPAPRRAPGNHNWAYGLRSVTYCSPKPQNPFQIFNY